jgi:hypothetical protein
MSKGKMGLMLAAVAAYGVYRYSRMTADQKEKMKAKGRKFVNRFKGMGGKFGENEPATMGHF